MRHGLIQRKLGKVDRAIDKAIDGAEMPGAVVLAKMHREGEVLEHASVRGLAVVRPERLPMAPKLAVEEHGSAGFEAPGTFVLALALLVCFVVYYFINWDYLASVWPLS